MAFGRPLPTIRARADKALSRRGLSREKVLALVVRLLEITLIRVGNEEYGRENASFGLTTLRRRHVAVPGGELRFRFRGKGGKEHAFGIRDRRLSRIVKRCQELPGQELFRYLDGRGRKRGVGSADVNAYLRSISGRDFTAKDFRTWAGTVRAAYALNALASFSSARQAKRSLTRGVESVVARLRRRRGLPRGALADALCESPSRPGHPGLNPYEQAVLSMLAANRRRREPVRGGRVG